MRNKTNKNLVMQGSRLSLIALAVATAFPMHAALAASAENQAEAGQTQTATGGDGIAQSDKLETVIVTANRRSENARDVPMSISAIKGDQIDTLNAGGEDITVLAGRVPSLNVESDFGRSFPRFYIRGLGNIDFDLNASQPVGLVYDDVVQENPIFKGFPIFDLDQVEVLRGPQGTLFGRNSPAGVVKFDSAKPTNTFEGYATFGVGRFGATNFEGAVNTPLGNGWAMRLSGQAQNRDDFITNPQPTGTKNFGGYHDDAARLQLLYTNGGFNALFNVHGRDMSGDATLFRANIIQPGTTNFVPGFNLYSYPTDGINTQTLYSEGASARLTWNLDGVTLHSITAWDAGRYYSRADVDGGYGASYALPMGPGVIPFPSETADGIPSLSQLTQEFRIQSNTKDPLQWIGGLYFFRENVQVDSFDYNSLAAGNPQDGYAFQHQHAKSWAAFGSLNYAVNDRLKLRAGLRYTNDKKDFDAQRTVTPGSPANAPAPSDYFTANPSSNNTSWDLSADYAVDSSTSIYARVATGYRAPSIQGRVLFGDSISVGKAETNLSYEAGIKKDLLDGRARINATVYTYRVSDMQLTAGSGATNQNQLVNAAKVTGQGFEVDMQAKLNRNWRSSLGFSYNKTKIEDPNLTVDACGDGCTVLSPVVAPGVVSLNGSPLPRAPEWTANFNLRYDTPLWNGEFYADTDWTYKGKNNMFLYSAVEFTEQAMLIGGVHAGYKWDNGKYEVGAYIRNVTNHVQLVSAIDFNNLTGIVNDPRTFGLQFKTTF